MVTDLDLFLDDLSKDKFTPLSMASFDNTEVSNGKLSRLLKYIDEKNLGSTVDRIKNQSKEKKKVIIKNLFCLYPISQKIIYRILEGIPEADDFIIEAFDFNSQLCEKMKDVLDKLEEKCSSISEAHNNYRIEIEDLDDQCKDCEEAIEKEKAYRSKLQTLRNNLELLEKQTAEEEKNKIIEELEQKIKKKEEEKRKFEVTKHQIELRYNQVCDELSKMEKQLRPEQANLLRQLVATFPSDREDKWQKGAGK